MTQDTTRTTLAERLREPVLSNGLTFSRDTFCVLYVDSGDAEDAFKRAFGVERVAPNWLEDLFLEAPVMNRISQLWERRIQLLEHSALVDIERLTKELEMARQLAMSKGQAAAAVSATLAKAKIHGLLIDRHQFTVKRPEEMTDEELVFITQGTYKEVPPATEKPVDTNTGTPKDVSKPMQIFTPPPAKKQQAGGAGALAESTQHPPSKTWSPTAGSGQETHTDVKPMMFAKKTQAGFSDDEI